MKAKTFIQILQFQTKEIGVETDKEEKRVLLDEKLTLITKALIIIKLIF